jgi:uncharacterized protein YjbI with pentapeptide repeats
MPTDPLTAILLTIGSFTRATTWVTKLAKAWKGIKAERRQELAIAAEDFGNLEALAEVYVEPDCQPQNPADQPGDDPVYDFRKPVGPALGKFLKVKPIEHDGSHVMFILSDAGMGKSSLLMMLKLSHELKFWPSDVRFALVKIGEDTVERLKTIEDKPHTVLLLDSLDEDPSAWGKIEQRLGELLQASKAFRQVVLTCRTQFFPKSVEDPRFGRVEIEGFRCNLLYLSPFSDDQIRTYLKKGLDWTWPQRLIHFGGRDSDRRRKALEIMSAMGSLRMRPMLLGQIEDLMSANVERWDAYSIYDVLVDRWLNREVAKTDGTSHTKKELRQACKQLAVHLFTEGRRKLSEEELDGQELGEISAAPIKSIDVKGRSLLNRTSDGDFRFSHLSIQEFFVAESFVLSETKSLHVTDQILEFLAGWIVADRKRVQEFHWEQLDYSRTVDLTRLGHLVNERLNTARVKSLLDLATHLRGVDLQDAVLLETNLQGANLQGANFQGAIFQGVDLTDANLQDANLQDANLTGAKLQGATLTGATLTGVTLTGANLQGASLQNADLQGANLQGANFQGAQLRYGDLRSDLRNAKLQHAKLRDANLVGADLRGADLQGADLRNAKLQGAKLRNAKLQGAKLRGADLHSADLRSAGFQGADLTDAKLQGANLRSARLVQAHINAAMGDDTTELPDGMKRPAHWPAGDGL